jgi:phosphoribosylglycinamide formyltransferase-1
LHETKLREVKNLIMKILVTGAKGFVGKNLVENLKTIRDGKNKTRQVVVNEIYEYDIDTDPALLPAFGGKGYYGLRVHEAVLAYGAKVSGATVHFVSAEVDGGAIIAQSPVPVEDGDTPESLQQRVLAEEHKLLPAVMRLLCEDKVQKTGRQVRITQ